MTADLRRIIWLASYPKSGNTWMRSLLAHYFMPKGQAPDINHLRQFTTGDTRTDFFDRAAGGKYTGTSVEEWMRVRGPALRLIAASKPDHHFVKTARTDGGGDLYHAQPVRPGALLRAASGLRDRRRDRRDAEPRHDRGHGGGGL